jgi:DNA-binding CsgD family transcriptional regulator
VAVDDGPALEELGRARYRDADYPAAIAAHGRAFAAYRRDGDALAAARTARLLAWLHGNVYGEWAVASGWTARAIGLLEPVDQPSARGWVLQLRAYADPDLDSQLAAYQAGRALGAQCGDVDLEVDGLVGLGLSTALSGDSSEGTRLLDEALAGVCAGEVQDLYVVEGAFCAMFQVCELTHDVPRAEQWLRAADALVRERGIVAIGGFCKAHWGGILTAAGRWEEAEAALHEADRIFASGYAATRGTALVRLADLRLQQGRSEEAAALLDGNYDHPDAVAPLAALHLSQGRPALARVVLEQALPSSGTASTGSARLLGLLVDAQLASDDVEGARRGSDRLNGLAAREATGYLQACAALARAKLCLRGAPADARGCLDEAVAAFTRVAMPVEAARARLLLASVLASSLPDAAAQVAATALQVFVRSGARRDADEAAALLRRLDAPLPGPARSAGALTRRESEVLELVALGLTNTQIASRLFISAKTVEHHVGHVLAKLGLRNRTEAARFAREASGSKMGHP